MNKKIVKIIEKEVLALKKEEKIELLEFIIHDLKNDIIDKSKKNKKIDVITYCGMYTYKEDDIEKDIQELREEWERNF